MTTRLYYSQHLLVAYRVVLLNIQHGTQSKGDRVPVALFKPSSLFSRGYQRAGGLRNVASYGKSSGVCLQANRSLMVEMRDYWGLGELALEVPKGTFISGVCLNSPEILPLLPPFSIAIIGQTIFEKSFLNRL